MIKTIDEYQKKLQLLNKYDKFYYDSANQKYLMQNMIYLKKELIRF